MENKQIFMRKVVKTNVKDYEMVAEVGQDNSGRYLVWVNCGEVAGFFTVEEATNCFLNHIPEYINLEVPMATLNSMSVH